MKKFLIIRFSSIGDMVLTSPVVRCLKMQVPGAEIHYLTKKQFVPVLEANPFIDKIYSIKGKVSDVMADLKNENYDHVIDLHKNFRSKEVLLHLRKPSSAFSKINLQKWLIVNTRLNTLPPLHIVDRYFRSVSQLGVSDDHQGLDYFIPRSDWVNLQSKPALFLQGYIGWVIGGKHNTKIFPEERVIEICKKLNKPIILLGGPDDAEKGDRIQNAVGNLVFNSCGKYTLNQSASLVQQADKIFTNDTGLMHIAAAFKKEIFSFWGNTIPEFGMYPYFPGEENKSHILEVRNLKCRPCSKIGFEKCPKGHFDCMKKIDVSGLLG